jgi:pantoate--beta-alanine ligase
MILFKKAGDLKNYLSRQRLEGRLVGFVPTMGALHEGHLSLVSASRSETDITVSSIFINPTQFNDPRDFQKYPVTLERDIAALESAQADALFLPAVPEIYPAGLQSKTTYNIGYLEHILEGKYRPGHFQGVCEVMERLILIVQPDHLFMGQKDYQQCLVVKRLLQIMDDDAVLHRCPTLREADGLAMSSRNLRLSTEERQKAIVISKALLHMSSELAAGNLEDCRKEAWEMLEHNGLKPDYVEMADAETLMAINEWSKEKPVVILIAAYMNEVRLIDNMVISG